MKQYFVLTDSSDNSVYGIAIKEDGIFRAHGAHGRSAEWATWINAKSAKSLDEHLPIGVVMSQPRALKSGDEHFVRGLLEAAISGAIKQFRVKSYVGSEFLNAHSTTPTIRDYQLGAFPLDNRQRAINFKALAFTYDRKAQSFAALLRSGKAALDVKTGLIQSRISGVSSPELQAKLDSSIPRIAQRRIGLETSIYKQNTISNDINEKRIGGKLGSRIGRGLRAAPSGMVFVDITGAIDADTDGIVFEGKPGLERPIIPRFTLPEALGRRISSAIQGDAEENEKLRRTGQFNEQTSAAKLRELLGSDSLFISEADATTAMPRPRVPVDRSMARRAIMQNRGMRSTRTGSEDFSALPQRQVEKMDAAIRKAWNIKYRLAELQGMMARRENRDNYRLRELFGENLRDYNAAIAELVSVGKNGADIPAYRALLAERARIDKNPNNRKFHDEIRDIMNIDVMDRVNAPSSRSSRGDGMRSSRTDPPKINLGSTKDDAEEEIDSQFEKFDSNLRRRFRNWNDAKNALYNLRTSMQDALYDSDLKQREIDELVDRVNMIADSIKMQIEDTFGTSPQYGPDDFPDSDEFDYDAWVAGERQGARSSRGRTDLASTRFKGEKPDLDAYMAERLADGDLSGADLEGVDFTALETPTGNPIWFTNLSKSNLRGAKLRFESANTKVFDGADLSGADLTHPKRDTNAWRSSDFRWGSFVNANLSDSNLDHVNFYGSDFTGANLRRANLSSANLAGAKMSGADLRGADLSFAELDGADLSGADLTGANLKGARLYKANLVGAKLPAGWEQVVSARSMRGDNRWSIFIADEIDWDTPEQTGDGFSSWTGSTGAILGVSESMDGKFIPYQMDLLSGSPDDGSARYDWMQELGKADSFDDAVEMLKAREEVLKKNAKDIEDAIIRLEEYDANIRKQSGSARSSRSSIVGAGGRHRIDTHFSSAVDALTWDDDNKTLTVTFGNGRTYTYLGVPDDLVQDLETGFDSVGKIVSKVKKESLDWNPGGEHASWEIRGVAGSARSYSREYDPMYELYAEEAELQEQALREKLSNIDDFRPDVASQMFADSSEFEELRKSWEANGGEGLFEESEEYIDAFGQFTSDNADEIDRTAMSLVGRAKNLAATEQSPGTKFGSSRSSRSYSGPIISGGAMPSWGDLDRMDVVPGPVGSNGGRWYQDASNGRKFFVKPTPSPDHAFNEAAVAAVYRAAGTPAPNIVAIKDPSGKYHIISEAVPNLTSTRNLSDSDKSIVKQDMGIDMLLSNWDVFGGGDNTKKSSIGSMYRLDTGGGGMFRARGGAKPSFNPNDPWIEPATMVYSSGGQSQQLYGRVSNSDFVIAMDKVANLNLGAIDDEMRDSGVPDIMRKIFMDTIRARQKMAKDYVDTFSKYDRDARVNVSGTKITPGGNKLPDAPLKKSWLSRRSTRSAGVGGGARSNRLLSYDAPEQAMLPELYDGSPSPWGSVSVMPNTLSLLRQKRQQQFNRLIESGLTPDEAANRVVDAHIRSNMRQRAGIIPTSLNTAAYAEYADGYDSMLETLDGWPKTFSATSEMKQLRQNRDRISSLDGLFRNIDSSSSRSVRWMGTKKTAPSLRDDIQGTVVMRGKEGGGIRLEIVQDQKTGRFIISGRERMEDGSYKDIGFGIIDDTDDASIGGEYDSIDMAIDAVAEYVDGPYSYEDELDDLVSFNSSARSRNGEILSMRSSVIDENGNLERPARGFHYADLERMSDRQLFDEYRNLIGRSALGENVSNETQAAQRALQDRRLLSNAINFTNGAESPSFDEIGRITGVPDARKPLASFRSGSSGNYEIAMTYRQLGSLERDSMRVREMLNSNAFNLSDDDLREATEAMDEFNEAVLTAGYAADSVIVSDETFDRLMNLKASIQDGALAQNVKGSSKDLSAAITFAEFIDSVSASGDKVFATDLLQSLGTMHDIRLNNDRDKSMLQRIISAARNRRQASGGKIGPSYVESRARRSNDARRLSVERDAFVESPEFDNYFSLFKKAMQNKNERRARGIDENRGITEQDYIQSPEFRDDASKWNSEKIREADESWVENLLSTPSSRADLLSSTRIASLSQVNEQYRDFTPSSRSARSSKESSPEEFLSDADALKKLAGEYDGPYDTDWWTLDDFREESGRTVAPSSRSRGEAYRTSNLRLGQPSERRRIATLEASRSLRSRKAGAKPGHERLLDTDGDIWSGLSEGDQAVVEDRLLQLEQSLIESLSGGANLNITFTPDGKIAAIEAIEAKPVKEDKITSVLGGRGNEGVVLYDLDPDFNFWGSAVELERAPRDAKEKARQAKINKFPLLEVTSSPGSDGKPVYRIALNERSLKALDRTYLAMRGELARMLEKVDDSKPAGKLRRKNILEQIAKLDERVTALKTIATARLSAKDSGTNSDGGHPFAYTLEQLPSGIRKEALGMGGEYIGFSKPKRLAFEKWVKTQTQQNGKKITKSSKAYADLVEKFKNGDLDKELFGWWKSLTPNQLNKLGLEDPSKFIDDDGNVKPDINVDINIPSGVDLDAPHSAKELGMSVPGIGEDRVEKARGTGFWETKLFQIFRPNNEKWLERQRKVDARRLEGLKTGQGVFGGRREEVVLTKKERRILKKRRAERLDLLKRKQRTADEINAAHRKQMESKSDLVSINDNGDVSISDAGVEALSLGRLLKPGRERPIVPKENESAEDKKKRIRLEKEQESRNAEANEALEFFWRRAGFNGRPLVVTEDEYLEQAKQPGAIVIRRGVGGRTYAEQYMDDDNRFTTEQGGELQGSGEYWAIRFNDGADVRGESTQWDGYVSADKQGGRPDTQPGPGGIMAILPSTARIIDKKDLYQIRDDIDSITGGIATAVKDPRLPTEIGNRTVGQAALDLIDLIDENLGKLRPPSDPLWDTTAGKIIMDLLNKAKNARTPEERKAALDSLIFLTFGVKGKLANFLAPILGYDAIRAQSGVMLVMNRGSLITYGGVGGLSMTRALERGVSEGVKIPGEMADKLNRGERVD